ncbi:hypothetical protein A3709_20700 [Halioglobus sp. HI00S01]|nr:hypothetical protein A3709_20700 [Halioglobus sp. HI00S01]
MPGWLQVLGQLGLAVFFLIYIREVGEGHPTAMFASVFGLASCLAPKSLFGSNSRRWILIALAGGALLLL